MRDSGEFSSDVSPRTLKQTRLALSPATDVSPPPDPSDTEECERRRAVRMENLQSGRVRRNLLDTIPTDPEEVEGGSPAPFEL